MATIAKSGQGYKVQIRKKNHQIYATFSEKEIAELWARYHEDLIDNMENFDVPPEELITVEQCCELKIKDLISKNVSRRSLEDIEIVKKEFSELMNCPLNKLTSEMVRKISNQMLNSVVRHGGSLNNINSGLHRQCSPATVLRKLRCLSAVIGYMIEKGANIINPVQVVINQVKMSMVKKGISEDEE